MGFCVIQFVPSVLAGPSLNLYRWVFWTKLITMCWKMVSWPRLAGCRRFPCIWQHFRFLQISVVCPTLTKLLHNRSLLSVMWRMGVSLYPIPLLRMVISASFPLLTPFGVEAHAIPTTAVSQQPFPFLAIPCADVNWTNYSILPFCGEQHTERKVEFSVSLVRGH